MRPINLSLSIIILLLTSVSADVINFDDLYDSEKSGVPIPSDYSGFTWSEEWWAVSNQLYTSFYSNTYGSVSGEMAAFNGNGELVVEISNSIEFNFNGVYVTGWAFNDDYYDSTATTLTIEGYNDGALVQSFTTDLSAHEYTWCEVNFNNIDQLAFTSSGSGKWWLMDDFTYNEVPGVPEPSCFSLLMFGFITIGMTIRMNIKRK